MVYNRKKYFRNVDLPYHDGVRCKQFNNTAVVGGGVVLIEGFYGIIAVGTRNV